MISIADGSVHIQTTEESNFSPPSWFGEVVLMAAHLRKHDVLTKIAERVRFVRRRFGRYEVIDFLAVLFSSLMEHFAVRLASRFTPMNDVERLMGVCAWSTWQASATVAPVPYVSSVNGMGMLLRSLVRSACCSIP